MPSPQPSAVDGSPRRTRTTALVATVLLVLVGAGVLALTAGGATAPAGTATSGSSAALSSVGAGPSPTLDPEAATLAAEQSLAAAEDEVAAAPSAGISSSGLLADADTDAAVSAAAPTTALAALAAVPVKGRAPTTGYSRDRFGAAWADADRNGCDTRNDVLARDLTGETFKPGTRDCVVLTGRLLDPYSGRTIDFVRGAGTSEAVQIDHVVALSNSWQTGAQTWDAARRTAFANDPLNLLAVDGPLNQQKGDGDAATWLPPAKAYRCGYVARQVAVKVGYGLWMTRAERNAIATVLSTCPDEPLPGGVVAAVPAPPTTAPAPAPPTTTSPTPVVPPPAPQPAPAPGPADAYYPNCTAAKDAGAAPLYAGQPGYRDGLDRDHDGVACET